MTTNKELGYYWATYICANCGNKMDIKITYGELIYIFIPKEYFNPKHKEIGERIAPECEYCGCRDWSNGKAST